MTKTKRVSVAMMLVLGCAVISLVLSWPKHASQPAASITRNPLSDILWGASLTSASDPAVPRTVVYPYSVIPGGITSITELKRLIDHDPDMANHFQNFDLQNAKWVTVTVPRYVYVSYRLGTGFFWTTKKLALAKGELLLTDGTRTLRGRCANDISETPQQPVSLSEPFTEDLDTTVAAEAIDAPAVELVDDAAFQMPWILSSSTGPEDPNVPLSSAGTFPDRGANEPGFYFPFFGGPLGYSGPSVNSTQNELPVPAPEPSSFLSLVISLVVTAMVFLWSNGGVVRPDAPRVR